VNALYRYLYIQYFAYYRGQLSNYYGLAQELIIVCSIIDELELL